MISVKLSKRFKRIVRDAHREDEVIAALNLVKEGFGRPHAHPSASLENICTNAAQGWRGGWCLRRKKASWCLILPEITTRFNPACAENVKISAQTTLLRSKISVHGLSRRNLMKAEVRVLPRLHQHAKGATQMFRVREGLKLTGLS